MKENLSREKQPLVCFYEQILVLSGGNKSLSAINMFPTALSMDEHIYYSHVSREKLPALNPSYVPLLNKAQKSDLWG